MMELGSMEKSHSDKCTDDGSHSLPECWNAQRVRMTSFPYSAQVPSLSTALITSSSESSEEIDEEEEKAWPLGIVEGQASSYADEERRLRRPWRRPPRRSLLSSLLRRPSAPVWMKASVSYLFLPQEERMSNISRINSFPLDDCRSRSLQDEHF